MKHFILFLVILFFGCKKEVHQSNLFDVAIFPNPTVGDLNVTVNPPFFTDIKVSLLANTKEREQMQERRAQGFESFNFNISTYPDGVYTLEIQIDEKVNHYRILKKTK